MDIKTYLKTLPVGGQKKFAFKCDISPAYLSQIASKVRPCPEKLAIVFERATGGVVPCEETCPGVDWAYMRGTSPAVAQQSDLMTDAKERVA